MACIMYPNSNSQLILFQRFQLIRPRGSDVRLTCMISSLACFSLYRAALVAPACKLSQACQHLFKGDEALAGQQERRVSPQSTIPKPFTSHANILRLRHYASQCLPRMSSESPALQSNVCAPGTAHEQSEVVLGIFLHTLSQKRTTVREERTSRWCRNSSSDRCLGDWESLVTSWPM